MNKDFTKHNQALALKELGFDEPCLSFRYIEKNKPEEAPTYSQAFRWLRNQYATCWYIKSEYPAFYGLFIHNGTDYDHTVYDTYEEAESACLDKLIEICRKK